MFGEIFPGPDTGKPSTEDAKLANRAVEKLAAVNCEAGPVPVRFGAGEAESVDIPPSAIRLLEALLAEMARGNGVVMTSVQSEVAPAQAAEFLDVPVTHLVELLDVGRIPSRMEGPFRCVRVEDVLAYRREEDARLDAALDEMTANDQAMGLQ